MSGFISSRDKLKQEMAIMAYFLTFILVNGLLVSHTTPAEAARFGGLQVVSHVERPVRSARRVPPSPVRNPAPIYRAPPARRPPPPM